MRPANLLSDGRPTVSLRCADKPEWYNTDNVYNLFPTHSPHHISHLSINQALWHTAESFSTHDFLIFISSPHFTHMHILFNASKMWLQLYLTVFQCWLIWPFFYFNLWNCSLIIYCILHLFPVDNSQNGIERNNSHLC